MSIHRNGGVYSNSASRNPDYIPSNSGNPENYPSSHFAEVSEGGTVADQVRNSQAYKTAYALFSSLSDKSWLNRLLAIPTSVQDASSTWFDEHGLSNKFNDKQQANYQYCVQQIQNLMAEYYAWKNSLPITQVEQAQNAGFNSAITGNGVNSSELNPGMLQSDPSALQSTDPLSMLQQFVGLMSSASGGLTSIVESGVNMYKNLREVSRADDRQLFDFCNYLNENGFNIVTSEDGKSIDFGNLISQYEKAPRKIAGYTEQFTDKYKSNTEMNYWSHIDEFLVDEISRDLVSISYEATKAQYESSIKKSQYDSEYFDTLNPNNMAQYDERTSKYNAEMSKLRYNNESKFRDMYWKIVDKWKKKADKGSILHQQLLNTLLTGYNPFSFGYNALSTPVKDFMNIGNQAINTAIKGTAL